MNPLLRTWCLLCLLLPANAQGILRRFDGPAAESRFGFSAASAGDLDGDGFADLVVGAFKDDTAGTDAGLVQVRSGMTGAVMHTFLGNAPLDELGRAVAGAGDVDRDGYPDVIAGAALANAQAGMAIVYSGRTGAVLHTFRGDFAGDRFGVSVGGAGDLDGDGHADLVVGAYRNDSNGIDAGAVRVFSGRTGNAIYTLFGDLPLDYFGWSTANAGDVDRDGFDDLVVGAYLADTNGSDSGSARLFSGRTGNVLRTFVGDSAHDWFGFHVAGAGDVDRDGYADVIVGAYQDDDNGSDSGSARVFSGRTGSALFTFAGDSAGDNFGFSVAGAGDVNGDGFDDLVVGAYRDDDYGADSGSARVFSGRTGNALFTFAGDSAGDNFGQCVAAAGDVDGDGFDDLVVGSPLDETSLSNSGSAFVLSLGTPGIPALLRFDGDSPGDLLGSTVASAGDVDGDGYADLIAGAERDDNNGIDSGSARVVSGRTGSVLYTFSGDSAGDRFGVSVGGAGDVNGDGYADLIVGAWRDDNRGTDSGSARVFSGQTGTVLYSWDGDSAFDYFGVSVAGAGDVNADGYDDLVVGAWGDDNNGTESGSARVFSGRSGAILYTFNGDVANGRFGARATSAGDVNADGNDDVIVSAPYTPHGTARVFSGRNGALLYTWNGDSPGDEFGECAGAGDVDDDGFADVIVGAWRDDDNGLDSGSAKVFSGRTGNVLHTWNGDSADDRFGDSVAGAGDVDGDGFDDLIVGIIQDDNRGSESGSARVFSGRTGAILFTFQGDSAGEYFGAGVEGAGDANGDGFDDVIVGSVRDDNQGLDSGSAYVFSLRRSGIPARAQHFGSACPGSNLSRPTVDWTGRAFLGFSFRIHVRGAQPWQPVFLILGAPIDLELTPYGAPGCRLLASLDWYQVPFFSDARGMATPGALPVPLDASLVGQVMIGQWACFDPAANALGVTTSNAVRLTFGVRS